MFVNGAVLFQALRIAQAAPADMQNAFLSDLSGCGGCIRSLIVVGATFSLLTTPTQDVLLLWRLFVAWQRFWVVAVMALVKLGLIGCTVPVLVLLTNPDTIWTSLYVYHLLVAFSALHLLFNLGVTFLITYKLWLLGRELEYFFPGNSIHHSGLMDMMVDSGCLYTVATVINFALVVRKSPAAYSFTNILTQVAVHVQSFHVTLTSLLIILRIGFSCSPNRPSTFPSPTTIARPSLDRHTTPVIASTPPRQTKLQRRAAEQARRREMQLAVARQVEFPDAIQAPSLGDLERNNIELVEMPRGKYDKNLIIR
ncbi:hypothetical protein DACRYDRAFT_17930 [Dacryopinax primogenitus]|uniref:Uncharacterized protein n=1 Tax=Dacryopinax primogenitus (strain DJM 731) TaxID=1858805 RepID=M5G4U5_DACPD|nr:uncharacterized protein DACRYDRAFT_17930 [Dacryopinax primogenitus]EJT98767.1 hypothetical protein DACRYDRAFT_17930 [Dacryopinax primogenitus]